MGFGVGWSVARNGSRRTWFGRQSFDLRHKCKELGTFPILCLYIVYSGLLG